MRSVFLSLVILAVTTVSVRAAQTELPPIKSLRYEEDYSALASKADSLKGLDALKFFPLNSGRDIYLSLGGEFRERYEFVDFPLFGISTQEAEDAFLHRLLFHGGIYWRRRFSAFVQFGRHFESGREGGPKSSDENGLDLQQGFAEIAVIRRGGVDLSLRIGRQEMAFGSGDLIGAAERRNVRRSFDALRILLRRRAWQADAFVARPTEIKPGAFDDGADNNKTIWGVYAVMPDLIPNTFNIDLYYLGFRNERADFPQQLATEHRHSFGTRIWGQRGGWDFNTQSVVQFGHFDSANILAWGIGTDTGYTFNGAPARPRMGLKVNIASGDKDPSDGKLNTFNALFPRSSYFTEAALIQPSNIFDINASVTLKPIELLEVKIAWNAIWRASIEDAVYRSGPRPLIAGDASDARSIGHQIELATRLRPTRHIELRMHYVYFFAGPAVTASGGRNANFFMTSVALKF